MSVTLLGISIVVRLMQSWNALSSIVVTLSGIMTLVRLSQEANAYSPIVVTLSPIVTLVSLLQPKNALYPIVVISASNVITQHFNDESYIFDTILAPNTDV